MEKRFFIFLVLTMFVLLLYQRLFIPQRPQLPRERSGRAPVEMEEVKGEAVTVPPEKRRGKEGKDVVVETGLYRLVLTTSGARIKSYRLKGYEERRVKKAVLQKELSRIETELRRTTQKIEEMRRKAKEGSVRPGQAKSLEKKTGARKKLVRERDQLKYLMERNLLPGEGVELVPFDGDLYGNYPLTLTSPAIDEKGELNFALYQPSRNELRLDGGQESGIVEFRYVTAAGIGVKKRFHFSRDSYLIGLEIVLENNSSRAITEENFRVAYGPGIGLIKKVQLRGRQVSHFASRIDGKIVRDLAGGGIGKGLFKKTTMKWGVGKPHPGPVSWTALRNSYFAVALIPEGEVAGARLLENEDGTREVALKMPFSLPGGGEVRKKLSLYLGPQDMEVLRRSGSALEMLVDFGFWSWIGKPIHALLKIFYRWFGNYGLSIIFLSLTIKLVFYPFTHKSFEAMKGMQEGMKTLQPEIDALKEKYKDNPQKLNKATMELYKKRGVNPLGGCKGGCLPMLFQMPVFFALYAVLYNAIELRQAPFIHGWVEDLSSRDPYYVLPVLMGATMFLQQKLTGMGGTAGSAQPDQAKMMSIMMPLVLTFVFFNLPSGIVLYWLCFNVFTSLQQLLIKRKSGAEGKKA